MPNDAAVQALAKALPGLTHPGYGEGSIHLPVAAFRAAQSLPPDVAEEFAAEAGLPSADLPTLFAEAIVATLEASGYDIVTQTELANLRATTTPRQSLRQIDVHCYCGAELFGAQVRDADTDKPKFPGPALIQAIGILSPECALGHRPQ